MGKITEYQQGNLASSAVGVPEANLSGARALNDVANISDNLANTVLDVANTNVQKHNAELYRQQQAAEALQKEQKKALVTINNDNRFTSLDTNMGILEQSYLHQDLQDDKGQPVDPYARRQMFTDNYQKAFESIANNIADPQERADFMTRGAARMGSNVKSFNDKMDTVETNMAIAKTDETLSNLVLSAGQANNVAQYQKSVSSLNQMQTALAWTLGASANDKYVKAKKDMAESFLWNLYDTDPNQMMAALKTGVLDDSVPPKDIVAFKHKWETYATQRIKVQGKLASLQVTANNLKTVSAAADLDNNNILDPQEMELVYEKLKASGAPKYQQRVARRAAVKAHGVDPDVTVGPAITKKEGAALFNIDKSVPVNLQVNSQLTKQLQRVFGMDTESGQAVDDLSGITTKKLKGNEMQQVETLQRQIIYAQQHRMIQKQTASKWYSLADQAVDYLSSKGQQTAAVKAKKAQQHKQQADQARKESMQFVDNMLHIFNWNPSIAPKVSQKIQGHASDAYADARNRFIKMNGGKAPTAKQDAQLRDLAKRSAVRGHK